MHASDIVGNVEIVDRFVDEISVSLAYPSADGPLTRCLWFQSESEAAVATEHVWQPLGRVAGARDRRAMVHACRALRIQIKCFEDDFRSAVGHAPRGSERLPLAST